MMNAGNENAGRNTNLGLPRVHSNHCISTKSSNGGAGVNAAASGADMTFVASDPLSELVWSPHRGLSLKCAKTEGPSPRVCDVGPSKCVDEGKFTATRGSLALASARINGLMPRVGSNPGQPAGKSGDVDEVNSGELNVCAEQKETTHRTDKEGIARESDGGSKNRNAMDFLSPGTGEQMMPMAISSSSCPGGRDKDSAFDIEIKSKDTTTVNHPTSELRLERLECIAENELPMNRNAGVGSEKGLVRGTSLIKEKGKEKVLLDGDADEKMSEEEEESDQSVESRNSVGDFSFGKRRSRLDGLLNSGSKRVKTQTQENPCSNAFVGPRSSFMNWISNMVKGLNRTDQYGGASVALCVANSKHGLEIDGPSTVSHIQKQHRIWASHNGFHNVFRSIYPFNSMEDTKMSMENSRVDELTDLALVEKFTGPNITPISQYSENRTACADVADGRNSSSSKKNGTNVPESRWSSRFSPKSQGIDEKNVKNSTPESSFALKKPDDKNTKESMGEPNLILPLNLKNKGVIASAFAKRLDALKLIKPSNPKENAAQSSALCFYCGKIGHDLRDCSEITDNERHILARNISSCDGIEVSKCLCIRCCQLDHWAISCPKALLIEKQGDNLLPDVDKATHSTIGDDVSQGEEITPPCNLVDRKLAVVPKGMFDAIRKLRLSRTDILKWMNSHGSLSSLDGYFLRVRLGKWEKGRGGAGYYASRLTAPIDDQRERTPLGSRKQISVDIWGKRCLVESRYVSNQDFLEDELMAWWHTAAESGGKFPTECDLEAKWEERKRLGL